MPAFSIWLLRVEVDQKRPEPFHVLEAVRDTRRHVKNIARLEGLLDAAVDRAAHRVVVLGVFLEAQELAAGDGGGRARLHDPHGARLAVNPPRGPPLCRSGGVGGPAPPPSPPLCSP